MMEEWAAILGMVLLAVFGCLCGSALVYYCLKRDLADWHDPASPMSVDAAPQWKSATGGEVRIDVPKHGPRAASYTSRSKPKKYQNDAYESDDGSDVEQTPQRRAR